MAKRTRRPQNRRVNKIARRVERKVEKKIARRQPRARRGPTRAGRIMREVGGAAGKFLGLGGLGTMLGAGISKVTGQGDYQVQSTSVAQGGPPAFGSLKQGFRVKHREYIQDIFSTVNYSSTSFAVNPGMPQLFPWLSTIAGNFEEYRIHGLIVYLNSNSANAIASTNTALGVWGAVTQYDPSEPAFQNKQQAENYQGCTSAVPSSCVMHAMECAPRTNVLDRLYIRSSGVSNVNDLKFFDFSKLTIFTAGAQATSNIGELWVTYDIEFFKPRLPTGGVDLTYTDYYFNNVVAAALPLGNGVYSSPEGDLFSSVSTPATQNVITLANWLPPGYYSLTMNFYSTASSVTLPGVTLSSGLALVPLLSSFQVSAQTFPQSGLGSLTNTSKQVYFQKLSTNTETITVASGTWTTGALQSSEYIITSLSSALLLGTTAIRNKEDNLKLDELEELRQLLKVSRAQGIINLNRAIEYAQDHGSHNNTDYEILPPDVKLIREPRSVQPSAGLRNLR